MKLKGLGKYTFDMNDGRIVVIHDRSKRQLCGNYCGDRKVYLLQCDDGKARRYGENILAFYHNNPHLPALCNNFKAEGVHISKDGKIVTDYRYARKYDIFGSIDDALETVLLVKSYQQGCVYPVLAWLAEAREAAVYTVTKFGRYRYGRVEACLAGADSRFFSQLEKFNVRRIMPLFAMYCKCLKQEIISDSEIRFDDKKYIQKDEERSII